MRREVAGGFELDDDAGRIDLDAVHEFVSNHSYWAPGRPREVQERMNHAADRLVGLYDVEGRQVGFTRTACVSGMPIAYLCDVYVLPEARGRGLGEALVRATVDEGPFAGHQWFLHTKDAHALYEKVGFTRPNERLMERARTS